MKSWNAGVVLGLLLAQSSFASNPPYVQVPSLTPQLVKILAVSPAKTAQGEDGLRVQNCTGILLTPTRVLTAAHCLTEAKYDTIDVFDMTNHKRTVVLPSVQIGQGFKGNTESKVREEGKKNVLFLVADYATFEINEPMPGAWPTHPVRLAKNFNEARDLASRGQCTASGVGRPSTEPKLTTWDTTRKVALGLKNRAFKISRVNDDLAGHGFFASPEVIVSLPHQLTPGDSGGPVTCESQDGSRVIVGINSKFESLVFEPTPPSEIGQMVAHDFFDLVSEEALYEAKSIQP